MGGTDYGYKYYSSCSKIFSFFHPEVHSLNYKTVSQGMYGRICFIKKKEYIKSYNGEIWMH